MNDLFSENEEKAHLLKSLIGTQSLAVVQLLLELCDGDVDEKPELREIREVACAQIHQMFIADSLLAKLVHFNVSSLFHLFFPISLSVITLTI